MPEPLITVNIDKAKAVILATLPASADRERILRGLGAAAMHTWKKLALEQLRSTSRDYIAGIQQHYTRGANKVEIRLEGRMPNMVEQGWPGGDMRQWLLTGRRARQGKNGPYNIIPFRHGTPGTGGRNVGAVMPVPIHDAAKKLTPTVSRPGKAIGGQGGQTTVYGQRLHPGMPMKQQARAILSRTEKPWHATSIYMGMIRKVQNTRAGGKQTSGYVTFRTISRAVRMGEDEGGFMRMNWFHPGIKARKLAEQTQKHMEKLAHAIIVGGTR